MEYRTETLEAKQKMLIVAKQTYSFVRSLKKELAQYQIETFFSSKLQENTSNFDHCFLINPETTPKKLFLLKRTTFIFINQSSKANQFYKRRPNNVKIVNVAHDNLNRQQIENIIWFIFSQSNELYLNVNVPFLEQTMKK